MPAASQERRRSPRYTVHGVRGWLTFHSEAKVVNLSLTGMSVETVHQLDVGRSYGVRLTHDALELRLKGTVVRCRLLGTRKSGGESRPVYDSGLHFDDTLGDKGRALERLLGASTEVALDRRLTGRFDLGLPESVRLRHDYQFEVEKISATGMLIVAELAPAIDSTFELEVALGGEELTATSRVAFVEKIGDGERCHLGVEFQEMSADDRRRLEAFIVRAVAEGTPG